MTLVVDASVALKWVLPEDDREAALALIGSETLIAPDFIILEVANTLAMKARRGLMATAQAEAFLDTMTNDMGLTFWPSRSHMRAAHVLANLLNRSAYDSLYLAMASVANARLVTADRKFAEAVRPHPTYGPMVRLL